MPSRITSPRRRRGFYLLLAAGAVAGFVALGLAIGGRFSSTDSRVTQNAVAITVACQQVNKLEAVIRAVLVQSLSTFGKKGTPGYVYYRQHPAELAAGRLSLKREIATFSSRRC